ncbi:MAG: hypothetical protein KF729_15410 [Sandaracinaceae bacterium]|nr:hypothetical protein [Sandaracinaceae bacterium]
MTRRPLAARAGWRGARALGRGATGRAATRHALALTTLALTACGTAWSEPADAGRARSDARVAPIDAAHEERDAALADAALADAALADAAPDAGPPPAFDPAAWEGAVIYFVLTDRFANGDPTNDGDATCTDPTHPTRFHGGDFQGIVDHLDYVEDLGADVLWITPVPAQVGCGYHGYWADLDDPDDEAIEPRLGGADGLTRLIDAVHARGMRLMVDHVVNHPGRMARITRTRPEWFHPPRPACEALGDPDLFCSLSGLPDFAHERADVRAYLDAHSARFTARFAFDAMRIDTVKHVPPSYFRDHFVPAVTAVRPSIYFLGEIFDEGYGLHDRYLDAGLHGHFDFALRRAIIGALAQGGSIDPVARRVAEAVERFGPARARLRSTFLDNHDVPRFLEEMGARPEGERRERLHLALAVLTTTPGIPQLYYGTELGMRGTYPENRRDMPAWAWRAETRTGAHDGFLAEPERTHAWTRRLVALRRALPALGHGDYVELWRPGGSGVELWAFLRAAGASRALVTFNAGATALSGRRMRLRDNPNVRAEDAAAFPDDVVLVDRLGAASGGSARVEGGQLVVDLPPRSVAVWTP